MKLRLLLQPSPVHCFKIGPANENRGEISTEANEVNEVGTLRIKINPHRPEVNKFSGGFHFTNGMDHVVAGEDAGPKLERTGKLGVRMIEEAELVRLCG